jgi:hypothetical protein
MSSLPSFYRISISGPTNSAPADGFVDNMRAEQYLANAVGADGTNESSLDNLPAFTLANSMAKKRGNIRYNEVVAQMGLVGNINISNIVATGASATSSATTFNFDVIIEHGDGSLRTWDETSPGTVLTNPQTVIARTISRALIANVTVQADILDPTANTSVGVLGATRSTPRYGVRYESLIVAPVYSSLSTANSAITVTALYQPNDDANW